MALRDRIFLSFQEAEKHLHRLKKIKGELKPYFPLTPSTFDQLSPDLEDKIDVLIFRFSRLQDFLGRKLFRNVLAYGGFSVERPFVEILAELERSGILEVSKWAELRDARNQIAHYYPENSGELTEAVNFIYKNVDYLEQVTYRLKKLFNEIDCQREGNNPERG